MPGVAHGLDAGPPAIDKGLCLARIPFDDRAHLGRRPIARSIRAGRRHLASELDNGLRHPGELCLLAIDDVLIRVVGVVVADDSRVRGVLKNLGQLVSIEFLKQRQQIRHAFCFSLHLMQTRVHGMAFNRAGAIGSPQSRQIPYVPLSIRVSASSIA